MPEHQQQQFAFVIIAAVLAVYILRIIFKIALRLALLAALLFLYCTLAVYY